MKPNAEKIKQILSDTVGAIISDKAAENLEKELFGFTSDETIDKFHALVNECFNKARGKRFQYHSGVTDKIKLLAQFAFEAHQHADDKIRAVQEQYIGLLVYVKMTLNFLRSDELSKRERITGLSLLKKHIEAEQKLLEANTIDTLFNEPKEGDLPF